MITQNLKRDKADIMVKHKNYSRQCEFELSNMNFYRFCSEATDVRVLLTECL